jgi:hypothetical protein
MLEFTETLAKKSVKPAVDMETGEILENEWR